MNSCCFGPVIDVVIDGNVFEDNVGAIGIYFTNGHSVINNTIVDDDYGVAMQESTGNVITGNTITAATPIVGDGGGNTIRDNVFP